MTISRPARPDRTSRGSTHKSDLIALAPIQHRFACEWALLERLLERVEVQGALGRSSPSDAIVLRPSEATKSKWVEVKVAPRYSWGWTRLNDAGGVYRDIWLAGAEPGRRRGRSLSGAGVEQRGALASRMLRGRSGGGSDRRDGCEHKMRWEGCDVVEKNVAWSDS